MVGETLRVLVVEDEFLVAMEIESMLEAAGHTSVGHADDLDSALEAADSTKPDIAFVDIRLARGASGLDVAAALKERNVPVLFITGNCPAERGRGLALGCLHKPVTDGTFNASLGAAINVLHGRPAGNLPSTFHLY